MIVCFAISFRTVLPARDGNIACLLTPIGNSFCLTSSLDVVSGKALLVLGDIFDSLVMFRASLLNGLTLDFILNPNRVYPELIGSNVYFVSACLVSTFESATKKLLLVIKN